MSKNVTLIDADSLAYLGSKEDTLAQIIEKVDYKVKAIVEETKADFYCLFISKGKYFRHALKDKSEDSGSYKANRQYNSQNYNKVIKEYLAAQYNAVYITNAEADDLIAYWMKTPIAYGEFVNPHSDRFNMLFDTTNAGLKLAAENAEDCITTLASIDKDLLESIPGKHLNYNKKTGPETWDMVWVETEEEAAKEFIWKQMIMGDTSDGIKGIPGKGLAYYNKLFQVEEGEIIEDQYEFILNEYVKYFGLSSGIYEFQKNYRLLHLLDSKEDWEREVGVIPQLPTFIEVKREEEIKTEF